MTIKAFNFRYLSPILTMGFLSLFYSGSARSQTCNETDLKEALEKAGHNSVLTKELKEMEGSWSAQVKKKADAQRPWTRTDVVAHFTVTADGKHLRHDSSQGEQKTTLSLATFNEAQKKYVMATCEGGLEKPVVMTGVIKDATIKFESPQLRASTFIKSATEMSHRVSLLKKDSPTSIEPREITVLEASYRRLPLK